jgi:ribosomal RNA assembly protein
MHYIKIPKERVPVLIGKKGSVKRDIEEKTGVHLYIDSKEGEISIDESEAEDAMGGIKAFNIVRAIGRGFSPERAMRLLEDDVYLEVIDIREFSGKKKNSVRRVRGRIIGTRGKTRRLIEELSGAEVSVYGNTVSIIGDFLEMDIARNAITMLLSGSEHSTVYHYLERRRVDIKIAEMGMYYEEREPREEFEEDEDESDGNPEE